MGGTILVVRTGIGEPLITSSLALPGSEGTWSVGGVDAIIV